MTDIPFTQYLRPDGRPVPVTINRPDEIATQAQRFIDMGGRFECEHLTTGHASLTAVWHDEDIAIEVVMNGIPVPEAVDRLVRKAMERARP
jgi:hypothetical protein